MADDIKLQDDYSDVEEVETGRTKEAAKKLAMIKTERDELMEKLKDLNAEIDRQEQAAKKRKARTRKLIQIGAALVKKAEIDWEKFDIDAWLEAKEKDKQDAIAAALGNAASETEKAVEEAVAKAREETTGDGDNVMNEAEQRVVAFLKDRAATLNVSENDVYNAILTRTVTSALFNAISKHESPSETILEKVARSS